MLQVQGLRLAHCGQERPRIVSVASLALQPRDKGLLLGKMTLAERDVALDHSQIPQAHGEGKRADPARLHAFKMRRWATIAA